MECAPRNDWWEVSSQGEKKRFLFPPEEDQLKFNDFWQEIHPVNAIGCWFLDHYECMVVGDLQGCCPLPVFSQRIQQSFWVVPKVIKSSALIRLSMCRTSADDGRFKISRKVKKTGDIIAVVLTCTWSRVSAELDTSPGSCLDLRKLWAEKRSRKKRFNILTIWRQCLRPVGGAWVQIPDVVSLEFGFRTLTNSEIELQAYVSLTQFW